jgi:hypothetical protein
MQEGLSATPTPMEVDLTCSDLDVPMPGTYHEEPPLNQPATSMTATAASLMEPAVQC